MLLTLHVNSIRSVLEAKRGRKPKVSLLEVPRLASEELGLHGLALTTDLLKGADRSLLEQIRDQGDKTGCACLLLCEPEAHPLGEEDEGRASAGVERIRRVLEAARLLGCSSAAVSVRGKDDEASFERATRRLKQVSEHAERLEVNLLVAPCAGLTQTPERATELVKKVGGFRIGTYPDFQAATQSGDASAYLRRLTPFAAAVNASTVAFVDPAPDPEPRTRAKAAARPARAKPAEEDADDAIEDQETASILEELEELFDAPPPPVHTAYELGPLVAAIRAVGYDGTLAIDYRGEGDGTLGVAQSRDALEAAIDALTE